MNKNKEDGFNSLGDMIIWDSDEEGLVFEVGELRVENGVIRSEVVVERDESI
ncbi:hypothetical protein [Staphylococcus epidermidis]|uniref:hypothetical protein n=1 Tax=Staphylococcus epidermidis TaxID=1282 RepID=UPI001643185F|nr:hypothetical protein [Staphylococcus epidermidis]